MGRAGDKAIVTFTNIQTTINTSIRFSYYMSGRDIGALYVTVGKSGKISWIQEGNKSPLWYYGCVDLPSNKTVNVSFIGIHGNGPLSDIAIDDVNLSYGKCPGKFSVLSLHTFMRIESVFLNAYRFTFVTIQ